MVRKKQDRSKSVTSKLPVNLKPFFEEMDLINKYSPLLAEIQESRQGFALLAQILSLKYEDVEDIFLSQCDAGSDGINCVFAKIAGKGIKNLEQTDIQISKAVLQQQAFVLQQKRPFLVKNLAQETLLERIEGSSFLAEDRQIQSALLVPMMVEQEMVGLIHLQSAKNGRFNEQDLYFLNALAKIVAPAMVNFHQDYKLTEIHDIMVEAWGRAVDQHEGESEGHCLRVADLTRHFAMRLGVRGHRVTDLWRGAMLHDLGKLGIEDAILYKETTLDIKEWEEMRRHPTFAYDIIRRVPFLKDSLEIPYCHHEKWDGSGYPRGLRGEEIPLVARIFALVDVWDALLSDRPFRRAWKKEAAEEYLRINLGSHFDPVIGTEFLKMLKDEPYPFSKN